MSLAVCVAGATGWVGRPIAEAVLAADDLELRSAVSRSADGTDLGRAWGRDALDVPVFGTVDDSLDGVDVLVDVTSHDAVLANTLTALRRGVPVVIGTSGLSADEFDVIAVAAGEAGVGVVAAGNFSLTAAMATAAALLVAPYLDTREIVDYASAGKPDAPSGTARELAERLGEVSRPELAVPVADTSGLREARGATVAGTQVHSVRLPSFVVSTEVVFALPDERLVIRHDAGPTPQPYVAGALLAVRAVTGVTGLVRGLDTLLLGR
ncbi:MAG TPA: 4-hydroxy-tetrahydrodipicolinate reductase [Actinomycetes bacterium]|nr:4-hydroxy-tetrahydrodipicolinate reductase [Actinomycetes bacterium]